MTTVINLHYLTFFYLNHNDITIHNNARPDSDVIDVTPRCDAVVDTDDRELRAWEPQKKAGEILYDCKGEVVRCVDTKGLLVDVLA